jgi:hypothetical protein
VYDFPAIDMFGDPADGEVNAQVALGFPLKPWSDYDDSCESRVPGGHRGDPEAVAGGFFPLLPRMAPAN